MTLPTGNSDSSMLKPPVESRAKKYSRRTIKEIRRAAILVMGFTVMLIGILLLVLPGPGVIIFLSGLSMLATEFYWAKKWLKKVEKTIDSLKNRVGQSKD